MGEGMLYMEAVSSVGSSHCIWPVQDQRTVREGLIDSVDVRSHALTSMILNATITSPPVAMPHPHPRCLPRISSR